MDFSNLVKGKEIHILEVCTLDVKLKDSVLTSIQIFEFQSFIQGIESSTLGNTVLLNGIGSLAGYSSLGEVYYQLRRAKGRLISLVKRLVV